MKRTTKLGIAIYLIIFTAVAAISVVLAYKSSLIAQDNFKVYVDTKQVELNDKSGSNMVPFKYNGETYLPLEPIVNLSGLECKREKDSTTIGIYDKSGNDPIINQNPNLKGSLTYTCFNKDLVPLLNKYFKEAYPNIEIKSIITISDIPYFDKIKSWKNSGSPLPDVIIAEYAQIRKFIDTTDLFADLTDRAKDYVNNMVPYTIQSGTDKNGVLRALSSDAMPGAIAYKKNVAKKYLGTDDPVKISEMLSRPKNMLQTAKVLKENSGGKVSLFPGIDEPFRMYLGGRRQGWIMDNKLTIDQKVLDYVDFAKTLRSNKYTSGFLQWSPEWSAAISQDETALAWLCPTWGIPWIIGSNDKKAADGGRWGLAKPSYPYFWGGTYFGIYSKSPNQNLAWEFVKFFTTNKEVMRALADNGSLPNSLEAIAEGSPEENKIVGTDVLKFFEPLVMDISSKMTAYDEEINVYYIDALKLYTDGKIKSKEEMIDTFKKNVKLNLKDIEVQ